MLCATEHPTNTRQIINPESQIPSTKQITIFQAAMLQIVWNIGIWNVRVCLGFRACDLGFIR